MIRRRIQSILLVAVLGCLFGNAAQAGLVSADFLDQSPSVSSSAASPVESGDTDSESPESDAPLKFKVGNLPGSNSSNGGTGGTTCSGVPNGLIALPSLPSPEVQPRLITRYLAEEASLLTATTFLEQVFRPPRQFN